MDPSTTGNIEAEYHRRLAANEALLARLTDRTAMLLLCVLLAAAATAWTGWRLIENTGPAWLVGITLLAAIVAAALWQRTRAQTIRALRLVQFYERGIARLDGTQIQSGLTGEAFTSDTPHLYARDLDVLGDNSLFGMLCTVRTGLGERALADLLLNSATPSEVHARQTAVRDLTPLLDLREQLEWLGSGTSEHMTADGFDHWLRGPELTTGPVLAQWQRWALITLTASWIAVIAATLLLHGDIAEGVRNAIALIAVQAAFCLWLRQRVTAELELAQRLPRQVAILREGLSLMAQQNFSSELLCNLRVTVEAEAKLRNLSRSFMLAEQRAKEWYYAPALALAVGSHAAISLALWRTRHAEDIRQWAARWGQFEALLALATYAAEHPDNIYPEVVDDGTARFAGEGLWHPLLPAATAIRNDVHLDNRIRFLLISGSNMAGKSTLLRTVGANVVLALAGAPVCAAALKLTPLRIGASLAITDSLAEGKSKFLAEVERLRDLVALAAAHPHQGLFLIDEIFSGTNSADRRAAAEAVVRGLIAAGAIGALSTHDLLLAEIAEMPEIHGRNVHMASPSEEDPLGFDYLLKPGVNRTTNALAIVRMLGLQTGP